MATTTILQYLEGSGFSPSGATVQFGNSPLNRRQVETFLTETAITAGQLVALDTAKLATDATGGLTSLTVVTADFNSAPVRKVVVGVALESVTGTATSPQPVRICVRGVVAGVPTVGATAIGDTLILDPAGAAGSVAAQPASVNEAGAATVPLGPAIGYALTVAAAGTCTVYVKGLFN
jgi:hypothetical protein